MGGSFLTLLLCLYSGTGGIQTAHACLAPSSLFGGMIPPTIIIVCLDVNLVVKLHLTSSALKRLLLNRVPSTNCTSIVMAVEPGRHAG